MVKQSNIGEIDLKAAKLRAKTDEFSYERMPIFTKVLFNVSEIIFHLSDGQVITIPLGLCKNLLNATKEEREDYEIRGHFVFWDNLDESIEVEHLLNGAIVPKKPNKKTIRAIKASREGRVTKTKNVADLMQKLRS
ncbi:MAG: DUF2442 domain-containing protein [Mariniphaga sp.]